MSILNNKNGALRIIEATIAILIILGFLIVVQTRNREQVNVNFRENIANALEEISKNFSLRDDVFVNGEGTVSQGKLYDFVRNFFPNYLDIEIKICKDINKICSMDEYVGGEIYSGQRVLVQSVNGINQPLKLSIFVWRNEKS